MAWQGNGMDAARAWHGMPLSGHSDSAVSLCHNFFHHALMDENDFEEAYVCQQSVQHVPALPSRR